MYYKYIDIVLQIWLLWKNLLANPDFGKRVALEAELNEPDYTSLYTADAKGYTDYPVLV